MALFTPSHERKRKTHESSIKPSGNLNYYNHKQTTVENPHFHFFLFFTNSPAQHEIITRTELGDLTCRNHDSCPTSFDIEAVVHTNLS